MFFYLNTLKIKHDPDKLSVRSQIVCLWQMFFHYVCLTSISMKKKQIRFDLKVFPNNSKKYEGRT